MKKQALIYIIYALGVIFGCLLASCSQNNDADLAIQKDNYAIIINKQGTLLTGLFIGDFKGTPEEAAKYLNAGEIIAPSAIVTIPVAKGETLFIKIQCDQSATLKVTKNGEAVISLDKYTTGTILIFSNK